MKFKNMTDFNAELIWDCSELEIKKGNRHPSTKCSIVLATTCTGELKSLFYVLLYSFHLSQVKIGLILVGYLDNLSNIDISGNYELCKILLNH